MKEQSRVLEVLNNYEQLKEGLPFSSDVNMAHITRLIPKDVSIPALREKMIDRFDYLNTVRKNSGLDSISEIGFGLAIALVDKDIFELEIDETIADGEDKEVADHEIGHVLVAQGLDWVTKSATVVPGSSYRGLTEAVPQTNLAFDDFAVRFAAICYGGAVAAQMMEHEVRGEGSDMAKAMMLARAVVSDPYSKYSSIEGFLGEAQHLAHSALSRYGASGIHRQAQILFARKTIT